MYMSMLVYGYEDIAESFPKLKIKFLESNSTKNESSNSNRNSRE